MSDDAKKPPKPTPCCGNCAWFGALPEGDSVGGVGYCQRFPPVVVVVDGQPRTMFPKVGADVACGEYRPHPKLDPVGDFMASIFGVRP